MIANGEDYCKEKKKKENERTEVEAAARACQTLLATTTRSYRDLASDMQSAHRARAPTKLARIARMQPKNRIERTRKQQNTLVDLNHPVNVLFTVDANRIYFTFIDV